MANPKTRVKAENRLRQDPRIAELKERIEMAELQARDIEVQARIAEARVRLGEAQEKLRMQRAETLPKK